MYYKHSTPLVLNIYKIETEEATADSDGGDDDNDAEGDGQDARDKILALKRHILTTNPDLFKQIASIPEDTNIEGDPTVLMYKAEFIAEMLRDSPPCKLVFIPYIDQLLRYAFRVDPGDSVMNSGWHCLFRCPIGELLRPDPNAENAHRAAVEALSREVKALSDLLPSDLSASAMTEDLAKKQKALTYGLQSIAELPLKPDAVPAFIQAGGLDVLLGVFARGPLSLPDMESPNDSLEHASNALYKLMDDSSSSGALAEALVERQAVIPLIKNMTYICGLEGVYSAPDVPRTLPSLAKWNKTPRKQIVEGAKRFVTSKPEDFGPGAALVLWGLIEGAQTHDIDEMKEVNKSKKYVSFFLAPCEPGTNDYVMIAAGEALAHRIGQPGHQLRKGIATPPTLEKFMNLLDFDCSRSASDISPSIQVLRELVLPTSEEDTGGAVYPEEDLKRVNKQFCQMFSKVVRARWEAAQALASKDDSGEDSEVVIQEPSEEGLTNMKVVSMLKVLVDEQYTAMALLADGLLDYQQYLLFSSSALTRRAGLELLGALCHGSSLMEDFTYVPNIIDAFKPIMVHMLDDSRALIRALALQWLGNIMGYRHPKGDSATQYKPAVDFVTESVSSEKLVAMLKGNSEEVKVAAAMVELMARHSTGFEVQDRLGKNEKLVELLWDGVFWDEEKVSVVQPHIPRFYLCW